MYNIYITIPLFSYSSANQLISDTAVKMMGKQSLELTHVYLSDCHRITDHSMKALASCKNLTVLNVADCIRWVIKRLRGYSIRFEPNLEAKALVPTTF